MEILISVLSVPSWFTSFPSALRVCSKFDVGLTIRGAEAYPFSFLPAGSGTISFWLNEGAMSRCVNSWQVLRC